MLIEECCFGIVLGYKELKGCKGGLFGWCEIDSLGLVS